MGLNIVKDNLKTFIFIKEHPDESIIFTDVDGTLSEIAENPTAAIVAPKIKDIIARVADIYKVVAISGRPPREIKKMIGSENIIYVGSHGWERLENNQLTAKGSSLEEEGIKEIKTLLARSMRRQGIYFEGKENGLAVHYRLAENRDKIKEEIIEAVGPLVKHLGFKVILGKMVVEISSNLTDKGEAMADIIREFDKVKVLYIGDDQTDVDAFMKLKELRGESVIKGFALGVLSPEVPDSVKAEADYFFRSVDEVAFFLQWLTS